MPEEEPPLPRREANCLSASAHAARILEEGGPSSRLSAAIRTDAPGKSRPAVAGVMGVVEGGGGDCCICQGIGGGGGGTAALQMNSL